MNQTRVQYIFERNSIVLTANYDNPFLARPFIALRVKEVHHPNSINECQTRGN